MPAPSSESAASALSGLAGLPRGFAGSANRHPARPALVAEDRELTYASLRSRTGQIASVITQFQPRFFASAPDGGLFMERDCHTMMTAMLIVPIGFNRPAAQY
ncbi:MAG: hypothetical protein WCD43_05325 [Candidatus Acidiferrales bacterium]